MRARRIAAAHAVAAILYSKNDLFDINNTPCGVNITIIGSGVNIIDSSNTGTASTDTSNYFTDNVGKNVGQSLNDIKVNNRYRLIDTMTGKPWRDNLTYDEAHKLYKDKTIASHTRIEKYASGTRNSKGGLIIKDEDGYEMMLSNQGSGKYALANEGSQIFTKEETDNMDEWVKFDPDTFMELMGKKQTGNMSDWSKKSPQEIYSMEDTMRLWGHMINPTPLTTEFNKVNNNNNPIQIERLINVEGNIDSTNVKQMEGIADKAVNKLMRRLNDGMIYGK